VSLPPQIDRSTADHHGPGQPDESAIWGRYWESDGANFDRMIPHASSPANSTQAALSWSDPNVTGALDPGAFSLPIGTVTFLLTDIEGSTRHWQRDPDEMGVAVARVYALLEEAITAHGGVRPVEQGEGDSVVAAFSRASDAVLASRSVQLALHAESWTTREPIRVRMAVHTGDTTMRDEGNYMGATIIRTARLRAIAHGGQVVLSSVTHDLAIDQLGNTIELVALGTHRLKDLARPEDVWQIADPELPSEFPPLLSLDAVPNNLPVQLSSFVGRLDEIATLAALVRGNRLVTIMGTGGAGKTRLSQQVAAEVSDLFSDGTWWVELVAASDGESVPVAVAVAISARLASGTPPVDALVANIGNRRMLVVLDNCEHVIGDAARLVDSLLRGCPNLTVLTTSRTALEVPGELTWRVPALSLPPVCTRVSIDALGQFDAVRLFIDRAKRVRPNFVLSNENGADVAEICHQLDGIPLALELAAARCRSMNPAQIKEGLTDSLRILTGGARTVLPRQQTLEASIEWSYSLLTEADQILLCRLSVFVGGFTLDAAEVVAADSGSQQRLIHSLDVLDGLDRLVEQSLVTMDETTATGTRYRLLETVRQYAQRKLIDNGEQERVLDAHCAYFRDMFAEFTGRHAAKLADADNALAALRRLSRVGSKEEHAESLVPVVMTLLGTPRTAEFETLINDCIARFDGEESLALANVLLIRSRLRHFSGRVEDSRVDAQTALVIAEKSDAADRTLADALDLLGNSYLLSDPALAIGYYERAVPHAIRSETWLIAIDSLNGLCGAYLNRCQLEQAMAALDEQVAIERLHRAPYMVGWEFVGRAHLALMAADYDTVTRCVDKARSALARLGMTYDVMMTPCIEALDLGVVIDCGKASNEATAIELQRRLDDAQKDGQFFGLMMYARALSATAHARGDFAEARRLVDIVNTIGPFGLEAIEVDGLLTSAALYQHVGDMTAALANVERGRSVCAQLGNDIKTAMFDVRAGLVALTQRDIGTAETLIHGALNVVAERGFRREVVLTLEALVIVEAAGENWLNAVRLQGAAERLRDELGFRLRVSPEREAYAAALERVRAHLGESTDAAIAEGSAMPWVAAVAHAQRTRGARKRPSFGWKSLTPTEAEVVALASTGLANPEIAARLLMGRATVKTHLSSAYTKLGVKNRTELASFVATQG
jgi:predicted ATPase/class 3 adenylate cyclase/DNA-binding CsgD family transcriptional regulator